jgi:hypothetical protein
MDLLGRMSTFVRIVDGGSLSAAARALHLSLPAVSRQLDALEQELGTSLYTRCSVPSMVQRSCGISLDCLCYLSPFAICRRSLPYAYRPVSRTRG